MRKDLDEHPSPEELEDFVWDFLPARRARVVASHLAGGCADCRAAVAPHLWILGRAEPPERVLTPAEDAAYEVAMDRAFSVVVEKAAELRQKRRREALKLLVDARLEELPEVPRYLKGVPLVEALLERSWALRHEDPQEMVRLAELARMLVERLKPVALQLGTHELADLRSRVWMELGNAYRVADDLAEAEGALGRAVQHFLQGTGDEVLMARLFDFQGSLYGALRHFDLGQAALHNAFAIHMRRGDTHLAGRSLIKQATYLGHRGDSEEAIRLLKQGLGLIDERRDPGLVYLACHNQARLLLDCGRPREARIALFNLKARGLDLGGRVTELKLRWLEGQINVGMGELDRAEQTLLEVRTGFEKACLGYKAALAGLEAAAVMLQRGRTDAAIREALQDLDIFLAVGIGREAAASVLLLRKSFERNVIDAKLLERVIGLLRRGEDGGRSRSEVPADPL